MMRSLDLDPALAPTVASEPAVRTRALRGGGRARAAVDARPAGASGSVATRVLARGGREALALARLRGLATPRSSDREPARVRVRVRVSRGGGAAPHPAADDPRRDPRRDPRARRCWRAITGGVLGGALAAALAAGAVLLALACAQGGAGGGDGAAAVAEPAAAAAELGARRVACLVRARAELAGFLDELAAFPHGAQAPAPGARAGLTSPAACAAIDPRDPRDAEPPLPPGDPAAAARIERAARVIGRAHAALARGAEGRAALLTNDALVLARAAGWRVQIAQALAVRAAALAASDRAGEARAALDEAVAISLVERGIGADAPALMPLSAGAAQR